MSYRGAIAFLATLVALLIAAAAAIGWYMVNETPGTQADPSTPATRATSVPFAFDDIAVSVHEEGRLLELLDVDVDGSMLLAFYEGGREMAYASAGGEEFKVAVEQLPGILLVTPDGKEHLLAVPSPLPSDAVGGAVGSLHQGSVAVSWQVRARGISSDGDLVFSEPSPTTSLSTGTIAGLTSAPVPTFDGGPVSVQWGGLHVADGALVALVDSEALESSVSLVMGIIDPETGELTAIDEGTFLAPMRDLCDATGATFGYVAVSPNGLVVHQFSVAQGEASQVTSLAPPEAIAGSVPFNACGSDTAALSRKSGDLLWTDGTDARSTSTTAEGAGDVFLSPGWVAAQELDAEGRPNVEVADRTTGVLHELGSSCQRLVAAGDWIAFGHTDGDTCTPVAVPVSEVLQDT